jgi:N-acetylmuramoyl-L-alanine amidase
MTSQRRFLAIIRLRPASIALCIFCILVTRVGTAWSQIEVWIDPGHCCMDPGAKGFNGDPPPNEQDLTMPVANFLQGDLLGHGYFAYKTVNHPTSFFRPGQRARIANGQLANDDGDQGLCNILVSIHMNSVKGDNTIYGTPPKSASYRGTHVTEQFGNGDPSGACMLES